MVFRLVLFCILLIVSIVGVQASSIEQMTLKNGMHIVVSRDTRSPVVLVSLWYHVGSANEHDGITGISHLLEHMMFRGTRNVPEEDFSKQVIAHGGQVNAFTSRDNTAYVDEVAVSQIPLVLKLEADRMQHLVLDPQAFLTEQKVVLEERHARVTDQPLALLAERYQAAAQTANPYQHPIVGWLADIQQLTTNDLYTWYYRWYQPNHATLVVVGDVKPSVVFKQAQDIFGGIVSHGQQSERKQFPLLPALGEKTLQVHRVSGISAVLVGFNVPTVVTAKHAWQPYALGMLAFLAVGNRYGWLYQDLVYHQKVAAGVQVHYTPFAQYNTLWSVEAVAMHGVPLAKLKKALLADIQLLAGQVSDPMRLQIAYTDIRAEHIYAQDTLSGQANWLGTLHANGVGMTLQSYLQQLHKVTSAQLQQVSDAYLQTKNMTVAELIGEDKA